MSESTRISAAQNPAENPSEAAYSDANWQSDFDALNGIQYILYVMAVNTSYVAWSDAIQSALDEISGACQMIRKLNPLRGPFVGLNPSDAAKLIASVAEPLLVLFPQPAQAPDGPGKYIGGTLSWIIGTCEEIDPSLDNGQNKLDITFYNQSDLGLTLDPASIQIQNGDFTTKPPASIAAGGQSGWTMDGNGIKGRCNYQFQAAFAEPGVVTLSWDPNNSTVNTNSLSGGYGGYATGSYPSKSFYFQNPASTNDGL